MQSWDASKVTSYNINNDGESKDALDQTELTKMFTEFGLTKDEAITLASYLIQNNGNKPIAITDLMAILDLDDNDTNDNDLSNGKMDEKEVKAALAIAKENKSSPVRQGAYKEVHALFASDGTINSEKFIQEIYKISNKDGKLLDSNSEGFKQAKENIRIALIAMGLNETEANQIIEFLTDKNISDTERKDFIASLQEVTKATTQAEETTNLHNILNPTTLKDGMPANQAKNGERAWFKKSDIRSYIKDGNNDKVNAEKLSNLLNAMNIKDPTTGSAFSKDSPLIKYLSDMSLDEAIILLDNTNTLSEGGMNYENIRQGIETADKARIMHNNRSGTAIPLDLQADDIREFLNQPISNGDNPNTVKKERLKFICREMGIKIPSDETKLDNLASQSVENIIQALNNNQEVGTGKDARITGENVKTAIGATENADAISSTPPKYSTYSDAKDAITNPNDRNDVTPQRLHDYIRYTLGINKIDGIDLSVNSPVITFLASLSSDQALLYLNNFGQVNDTITQGDALLGLKSANAQVNLKNNSNNDGYRSSDLKSYFDIPATERNDANAVKAEKIKQYLRQIGISEADITASENNINLAGAKSPDAIVKWLTGVSEINDTNRATKDTIAGRIKTAPPA